MVLCLIKAVALWVELACPLHAGLLRALLGNTSFGYSSSCNLFPRMVHGFLVMSVEMVVGGHEGVMAGLLVTEVGISALLDLVG